MTYAIVEAGGKQLCVEPGRFYDIDRMAIDEDEQVTLDRVLFVNNDGDAIVGQPLIEGASVSATVMRHLRGRKIIVYKMRPKKKTRKKQGHRQELTRLMIDAISLNGTLIAGSVVQSEPSSQEAPSEATAVAAVENASEEE